MWVVHISEKGLYHRPPSRGKVSLVRINGRQLNVTGLSVGVHTITMRADDGVGGVANGNVSVFVPLSTERELYLPLITRPED